MPRDFIPSNDDALKTFATTMSTKISASAAAYGLSTTIATTLASKLAAFVTALSAAQDPSTRGKATIYTKSETKVLLVQYLRQVARMVQGCITVTNDQRVELGLPVHKTHGESIPAPTAAINMEITERYGNIVGFRVHDGTSRRGKPELVAGCQLYTHVGPTPPLTVEEWAYAGQYTRTTGEVAFDADLPVGTKVWLAACWYSAKGLTGVACDPVSAYIAGGGVAKAAMKLAA
jgi:hypothetical protein